MKSTWFRLFLILTIIGLIVGSTFMCYSIFEQTEQSSQKELLLTELHEKIYILSAFKWKVLTERQYSKTEYKNLKQSLNNQLLLDQNKTARYLPLVKKYLYYLDEELNYIDEGDFTKAVLLDKQYVDPIFGLITKTIKQEELQQNKLTTSKSRTAHIGLWLIPLFSSVLILFLYLIYEKSRRINLVMINEQKILKDSEDQYRRLVEFSPDAVFIFDNGKCFFANFQGLKLLGASYIHEVIGKNIDELGFEKINWEAAPETRVETTIKRLNGTSAQVELAIAPYSKRNSAVQIIAHDISERKKVEEEILRFNQHRLLGETAAAIAHEIRNPMTTVKGFLQLFAGKQEFKGSREYFDLMIDELNRANSIIKDYLSLSNKKKIAFQTKDINQVLEKMIPLLEAAAIASSKEVLWKFGDTPDLSIDEKEIRQLILNLVKNGLDAAPINGKVFIETFLENKEVVLSIRDEGPGIPSSVLDQLGTPFLTTKENGTGLGLAVCYSIAQRHKAVIQVETHRGGTTFFIRFPIPTK